MKVAELVADIAFNFDSLKLSELVKKIGGLSVGSTAAVAGLAMVADKVQEVIKETDTFSVNLQNLSKATGVDQGYIQFLENVSEQYGATKQDADSFIQSLSQLKLKIAQGQADATPFALMGIDNFDDIQNVVKKTSEFMNDPKKISGWAQHFAPNAKSATEQMAAFKSQILSQMGANPNMMTAIEAVSKTNAGDVAQVSPETVQRALEAHKEWANAVQHLNAGMMDVVSTITIAGAKILEWVNNVHLIETVFNAIKYVINMIADLMVGLMVQGDKFIKTIQPLIDAPKHLSEMVGGGVKNTGGFLQHTGEGIGNFVQGLMPHPAMQQAGANKVNNNQFTITVHAQDAHDFVHKVKKHLEDAIIGADRQVGQTI